MLKTLKLIEFYLVFDGKCFTLFKEYYNKNLLIWEEAPQNKLKEEDEKLSKTVYNNNFIN